MMDSYDKLLAWLVDMAETDNCDIDTSAFINQIKVSSQRKAKYKDQPWRQNSTSCDSYASTETPQYSKSSRNSEDFIDVRNRLRVPLSSRQTTFSDDGDADIRKASTESLYNDSNRHKDFDSVDPKEILIKRDRDLKPNGTLSNLLSASVGDLLNVSSRMKECLGRRSASMVAIAQNDSTVTLKPPLSPIPSKDSEEHILDDELLDGNIADIFFAVEALWPKK